MEEQKDLLVEQDVLLTPAQPGLRFANYVIDIIAFYVIFFIVVYAGAGIINATNIGLLYLVVFTILIAYYTIMEGATNGKTLGKLVTKTRAVKKDGTTFTLRDAFLRSLCRLVPFEPFTAFSGYPWHDKWTNTIVIKE